VDRIESKEKTMLEDTHITLEPYTQERCHAFWQRYTADPAMWSEQYVYDEQKIQEYYQTKVAQPDRVYFAICYQGETVGEIQLKGIDREQKHATLSIHLADDRYKNRGWGSQAIRLLATYAFETLGLCSLYADSVHRNTRSQHVLQKIGFTFTHADDQLRYYVLHQPKSDGATFD
jgi:RimJ/RimL family protein N-acetyltransferase